MSGMTSKASEPNFFPVLPQPVITSSNINNIPYLSQISLNLFKYPLGGTNVPVEPAMGSTIHAAIFSGPIFIANLSKSSANSTPVSGCPFTNLCSGK